MQTLNKRGLAEVVLIVLIIMLSIASITIFSAAFLTPINQLSPEISCTEMKIEQILDLKKACFDSENNQIRVTIERSFDDIEINKINFRVASNQIQEEWCCGGSSCLQCLIQSPGATKTYILPRTFTEEQDLLIIETEQCLLDSIEIKPC